MIDPRDQLMVTQIEGLAAQIEHLFPDERRYQVTRRLLEAAAWRINYTGAPDA